MKCKKCSYEWNYKGKLDMASCPSCLHKNKTAEPLED